MYSAKVLEHFEHPRNAGELPEPCVCVQVENPACGDVMCLSLRVADGRIAEVRYKAQGCVASIACGSALTALVEGLPVVEAWGIRAEDVEAMLGSLPPTSRHAAQLAADTLEAALARVRPRARAHHG